ncbi:MAG: FAD-dependent monooxygenase, partial [Dermatophilaceae bacterium]
GPAGVVAGMLLGDAGVDTLVVDRRVGVSELPRARGIHARATEILRQLDIEADMVAAQLPIAPRLEVRTSMAEPPLEVVTTGGVTWAEVSPCEGIAIAQDVFENVLRRHLARRDSVRMQLGLRLTALDVGDGGGACATLVDEATGERQQVDAAYLLGADGWRSDVRRLLDIAYHGALLSTQRSIRFRADLSPWLGTPPPAFVRLPAVDGVLLPTHADNRWVAIHGGTTPPDDPLELLREVLGVEVRPQVLGDTTWTAAVQRAETFRSGPAFLLGDAAHRVTPAGASGISAAMADAHNLTWKIAGVLAGWADPRLLDSYAVEREMVARVSCAANLEMWQDLATGNVSPIDLRTLDMGYRYRSPVVADDGLDSDGPTGGGSYEQSARPGARAPHAWISRTKGLSTVDLFGRGFVVLAGPRECGWTEDARVAAARLAIPVQVHQVTEPAVIDAYGLGNDTAVVVRPDGHVACRLGDGAQPAALGDRVTSVTAAIQTAAGFRL